MSVDLWQLPRSAVLGGEEYDIRWRWQDVMQVLTILNGDAPEWARWLRAMHRFYLRPVPSDLLKEAAEWMGEFLSAGQKHSGGLKLLDWQQDAMEIVADINRVAGVEVRQTDAHWWTFLGWFHAIGEGRLSELVSLRRKLALGQPLTPEEQSFYRQNRSKVRLQPDNGEKQRLEALIRGEHGR